jgi:hypothetical protein
MPTMVREAWTDERLDDLKEHMDEGFRELRADLRQQREEAAAEFAAVRSQLSAESTALRKDFAEVKSGVASTDVRIDELVRTVQIGFWLIASFLVGLMGMFAAQL